MEWFIIGGSAVNRMVDAVMVVGPGKPAEAHGAFRESVIKSQGLPPGTHIYTATIARSHDETEIRRTYDRLVKQIEKREREDGRR
jgi:hypothetical protein